MFNLKSIPSKIGKTIFQKPLQSISVSSQKMKMSLEQKDPEVFNIISKEIDRQKKGINLIASENFVTRAVLDAIGSPMTNKYSEGYPGQRYYGGNEFIDQMENLCQSRALKTFNLDPNEWGVNVQSLSGSPANFEVYTALINPHDRIMSLDLPHGGHLSHGYQTDTKKISAVSKYFECLPYRCNEETGIIDYDRLEENAKLYRPSIIIAGASAYPRLYDYDRMRKICDSVGAYLMSDMAHISGLVLSGLIPSPFEYSDVVTTTTHKTLRGPRGAMIFYRVGKKGVNSKTGEEIKYDLKNKIDFAVFPGHQGGPHNHTIAALSVALGEAKSPEFHEYQVQVLKNSKKMAESFMSKGYKLVTGGTDNHLILIDLNNKNIDGARVETVLEASHIYINKNTVPGDKSALMPKGLRLGAPAMTSIGMEESDFEKVVEFVDRGVEITIGLNEKLKGKLSDFKNHVKTNEIAEITKLKQDVNEFMEEFESVY